MPDSPALAMFPQEPSSSSDAGHGMEVAGAGMNPHTAKTQAHKAPYLLLLIAGVAVILFGASGVSAVMAWMPNWTGVAGAVSQVGKLPPPARPVGSDVQEEGDPRISVKCAECGVVESTREIVQLGAGIDPAAAGEVTRNERNEMAGKTARIYEVTVRMKDGSSRVFKDASPTNWRAGQHLTFIEGASRSNN
jgi:hypothetical protein